MVVGGQHVRSRTKKPAAPEAPWALQFLTNDYLATGLVGPADYTIAGDTIFYEACQNEGAEAFQKLSISSAQLEPTGSLAAAEINCQLPGSKLKGWRAPWLLLNARQLHGYRLL